MIAPVTIDPAPLLAALRARKSPTPLPQVAAEIGPSAFEEFERELAEETVVVRRGEIAAVTATSYVRLVERIAGRNGGRLP